MEEVDEAEDEEEVVDAGWAVMRAGLWAAASAAATAGRMEGMSSGCRLAAGGSGGPVVTWRPGGPIWSAAAGEGGAWLWPSHSGLGWARVLQCARSCGLVSAGGNSSRGLHSGAGGGGPGSSGVCVGGVGGPLGGVGVPRGAGLPSAGVCGLSSVGGGIQTCWPRVCLRARQSTRSTMVSWRPLPGVVRSQRALTVSLVQSSCRRYQPRGVVGALSWRVARRRSGSRMVAAVRGGCPGSRGGGLDGLPGSCASTSMDGWPWLGSAGLGGAGWLLGCETGLGALRWCLGDLWIETGGACGARSGLVDVWVMHGMVMDETLHVFPWRWGRFARNRMKLHCEKVTPHHGSLSSSCTRGPRLINSQGVAYQVRASEGLGKSIVRGWPIKFVHQRPPVNR